MYGTKAAFDYVTVGGRCAYETNKAFEFPKQPFSENNSLYTTEHDDILCTFMDTSSYVEVLFSEAVDADKFYKLRLVYYAKNINNLKLKVTWKKEGEVQFCADCYENVQLDISGDNFLYIDIDLRSNSEWVGEITNLRLSTYNTEIVPLFIKYFSVYSPATFKCSKPSCPYYSSYQYPCNGGKDSHTLLGKLLDNTTISLPSTSSFLFSISGVDFVINFEPNTYFLDGILFELNNFFDSMPIPCLRILKDKGRIKIICDYTKPIIVHTELSEKLGFFNSDASIAYMYEIENCGVSDYIDVAGNLYGIHRFSDLESLNFGKTFSIGFSDTGDFYPEATCEFLNETVLFHTLSITFDGYLNCFEIYCKVLSGGGKILVYRRLGDSYIVVNSYDLSETADMSKQTVDWTCRVCRGDVIGVFNLKLGVSKKSAKTVNYYSVTSGYLTSIDKNLINDIAFASVSFYAYLKLPAINDIPMVAIYDEAAYVDKLSFDLVYSSNYAEDFNIIFNNTFSYDTDGCQINVKDSLDVVTEVSAEVIDISCLSDNKFSAAEMVSELKSINVTPPVNLSEIIYKDSLRYSWDASILEMYESNNYTYTFIPGSVFFYYKFPTIIDLYKVTLYNIEDQVVDGYLLKVLDNTKISPSFSNTSDIITVDSKISDWEFNIDSGVLTEGLGVFIYNYVELPNISFSEIELYTKVGSIPEYIVDVVGVTHDGYTIPFDQDINNTHTDVFISEHIKSLTINVNFITNNTSFDFKNLNIYTSFLPDDYFISSDNKGEGVVTVYNTRSKSLNCYLLDYTLSSVDNLMYGFNFDNDSLYKGSAPIKYVHSPFYFISSNYTSNEYNTYALSNMLDSKEFFVTKSYQFSVETQDDWYSSYDYIIPGYDGEFIYTDGFLKLRPLISESPRWFNYINTNEFYNDIDISLRFNYVGNLDDFVFIGLTCCDRSYNNYLKFYTAFQTSPEYGLEFKLDGDSEPTYYRFDASLGRDAGLKIKKRGSAWTFYYFYGDSYYELTTFTLFDTEILISISTMFNAPFIKDNVIASFKTCKIQASKIISGKKVWYTINDGLSYTYSGNILDNSVILDNFDKSLTFSREHTIKKFIYTFNTLRAKYLKFVNVQTKSLLVTEIKCYLNDSIIPIKQGYVSYSNDLFSGILEGETAYFDDNVIINCDLGHSIREGDSSVLSAVGIEFNSNISVNKAVIYYVSETGTYEPCRLMYSYDNVVYYDVYDNFSMFLRNADTKIQCFFNEFAGYKGKNEIIYDLSSNEQYSTDFSVEGVLSYKWEDPSPYNVDSAGVWLERGTGPNNIYSQFAIDGDFIIDVFFDDFNGYGGSNDCRVYVETIFQNNTGHYSYYVAQDFIDDDIRTRETSKSIESNRTSGGIRIKRSGSIFSGYYRKYGTTWDEVSSTNYGTDYVYPVRINIYLYGENFNLRIKKVLIIQGTGIASTDFMALESPSLSTLFVRGRQFSNSDTYMLLNSWDKSQVSYSMTFSLLHGVSSSIPTEKYLVEKLYSFGLTYENKDLALHWFSEYLDKYKLTEVLSYSSTVNSIATVSIGNNNINKNLFTDISDPYLKAVYKPRYDVNVIIDEDFGETISSDVVLDGDHTHVNNNYIKLVGGVVHSNKIIHSANAITFECSITVDGPHTSWYGPGLFISDSPSLAHGVWEPGCKNICIFYSKNVFRLNIDGHIYDDILNNDNKLFYPEYKKPYIIGIKFIPGVGTIIYWQGPTNGYLVIDYTINGYLYAWCGNMYGQGTYDDHVTTVHRFRCLEDKKIYKELINSWSQTTGISDYFYRSDGSGPNLDRWVVTGDPKIYSQSLKLRSSYSDTLQSKAFLSGEFEVVLDYSALSFTSVDTHGLTLNLECYDVYKDRLVGTSKFVVGYNGGIGSWVSGFLGDSSIYYTADVSGRKLKIENNGYNIQYFLSDGVGGWITIFSNNVAKQYYYKISVEGTEVGVVSYLNSIIIDCEDFTAPTDVISLVPTSWNFSPTDKAYYAINYVLLNELLQGYRTFSIDCVPKIDNSLFLSYIECDKDLVIFNGAIVVGSTHSNLIDALSAAENGAVVYILPGTYQLGGYILNKKVFIVGVGDYRTINVNISGSSVKLDAAEVIFKNVTINEQLLYNDITFRTQGDKISYFTMDNCKYNSSNNSTELFRVEGSEEFYVYLRRSYINHNGYFIPYESSSVVMPTIYFDILNCRITRTASNMFPSYSEYQTSSMIYSNSSLYDPEVTNKIPIVTLFSPKNETNIYLNTPNGLEKKITFLDSFDYISFGNCLGGVFFYGGNEIFYFSEYIVPAVDESFKLFSQGYIDTLRVFDSYITYSKFLENSNIVKNTNITLKLAHNNIISDFKVYAPLNIYNSGLELGRGTTSVIDEFIWSKNTVENGEILSYYNNLLDKFGYSVCNISNNNTTYKFLIDTGVTTGIGSLVQPISHNFSDIAYYSDDVDDPSLLSNTSTLSNARWYTLSNNIAYSASALTPGTFSIFPSIEGCDASRWGYTGESGYLDIVQEAVLSVNFSLTDIYNIKWGRNKSDINEYFVSNFSAPLKINIKTFEEKVCDRIVIESGYKIGTEHVGYITKCDIVIDSTVVFSIEDNVNSIIKVDLTLIDFTNIEIIIYETKQVPHFSFNGSYITGDVLFIKYIKVLTKEDSRTFNTTLCNVYELYSSVKLEDIDTTKVGTCTLDYYYNNSFINECVSLSSLDLTNLPSIPITSIIVKADNFYNCSFAIDNYIVDIISKDITSSIASWKVFLGDVILYEEFFYIKGTSTSIGVSFYKSTTFEVGTYSEDFGTNTEWAITDELVLRIYSSEVVNDFYICVGDKAAGRYYRWNFSLVSGWNDLRFDFYSSNVVKYVANLINKNLLFNDVAIFNVWFGGVNSCGFIVLDSISTDKSSVKNVLSSKKDAFYTPLFFESASGSVQLDFTTYWGSDGMILEGVLSDKVILSVFSDELCFSLVNKLSGNFVLGIYSYLYNVRTVKTFGKASTFEVNDKINLRLNWYCDRGYFSSELYINGSICGRVHFNLIEIDKLKVTGVIIGGSPVYITSIYNSLSLCGTPHNIEVYSSNIDSVVDNDNLFIKVGGEYKNLVENSPICVGMIDASESIKLPVRYTGKSKKLNELNLRVRWEGTY